MRFAPERVVGLSITMAEEPATRQRWNAYIASLKLAPIEPGRVIDEIWVILTRSCTRRAQA